MGFNRKAPKPFDPLDRLRQNASMRIETVTSSFATVTAQEEEIAALVGGKRHAGSGAFATLKSDASSDRYQIEAKQTKHASITLTLEWLGKISFEAIGKSKTPMMHLRFLNRPNRFSHVDTDWVVLPQSEFKRLLGDQR